MAKANKKKLDEHETGAEELFRRLKANPGLFIGTIVVLVITIVAFVFVPAFSDLPSGQDSGGGLEFGAYNGKPISFMQGNYFDRVLWQVAQYSGVSPEADYTQDPMMRSRVMGVWQEAFYATITREAILDEMNIAGYKAPEKQVDKEVAALAEFQENGRFSITKYRAKSQSEIGRIWKSTEADYTEQQYRDAYNSLVVSDAEKEFFLSMSSPERSFRMVSFPRSLFPDSEVAAFAASNPAHFKTIHLSKITVASSEKDAAQILETVKTGKASFEDTARNQSQDSYKDLGGDMGTMMSWELYRHIADEAQRAAVLALTSGQLSDVVKDPAGWAFYRCEASPFNADMSATENLEKARSYMGQFEGGRIENYLVEKAEDFITSASMTDFAAAAEAAEIPVTEFGPVCLNYGNVPIFSTLDTGANSALSSAVSNENFWKNAFSTPVGAIAKPFTLGSDVVVLEAVSETEKSDEDKNYMQSFFSSYSWLGNVAENDLRQSVIAPDNKKAKNDFFVTYYTKIDSPFAGILDQ